MKTGFLYGLRKAYRALYVIDSACTKIVDSSLKRSVAKPLSEISDVFSDLLPVALLIKASFPASFTTAIRFSRLGFNEVWALARLDVASEKSFTSFCENYYKSSFGGVDYKFARQVPLIFVAALLVDCLNDLGDGHRAIRKLVGVQKSISLISGNKAAELFIESSPLESVLKSDPSGLYAQMDFLSRESYHLALHEMARGKKASPALLAQEILRDAVCGKSLHEVVAGRKKSRSGWPGLLERRPVFLHLSLSLIIAAALASIYAAMNSGAGSSFPWVIGLGLLIFLEMSLSMVDNIGTSCLGICLPSKFDYSYSGIPYQVVVAIPLLVHDVEHVHSLMENLLWNIRIVNDSNVKFLLLSDLADSLSEPDILEERQIIEALERLVDSVNSKLGKAYAQPLMVAHRSREFDDLEECWRGEGRKVGKLALLNRAIALAERPFAYTTPNAYEVLCKCRYVMVVDEDTKMARNCLHLLAGALDHPANLAKVENGAIVYGHGLATPALHHLLSDEKKWRFPRMILGSTIDPAMPVRPTTNHRFNIFGQCLYAGKGMYNPRVYQQVCAGNFDVRRALSHDTIESDFLRPLYIGDAAVCDKFPSSPRSLFLRECRWARGDFINAFRLLLPDGSTRKLKLSRLGQYAIFNQVVSWLAGASLFPLCLLVLMGSEGRAKILAGLSIAIFPGLCRLTYRAFIDFPQMALSRFVPIYMRYGMTMLGATLLRMWRSPVSFFIAASGIMAAMKVVWLDKGYLTWVTGYRADNLPSKFGNRELFVMLSLVACTAIYLLLRNSSSNFALVFVVAWFLLVFDGKILVKD